LGRRGQADEWGGDWQVKRPIATGHQWGGLDFLRAIPSFYAMTTRLFHRCTILLAG